MSSTATWTKWGLRLACETSKRPLPKVTQAYAFPSLGINTSPLIESTLETIPTTGRQGIRVSSLLGVLPGAYEGRQWMLWHAAYVETPAVIPWEAIPIDGRSLNLLLAAPQANAIHRFYLASTENTGGQMRRVTYPEVTITTPNDVPPASVTVTPMTPTALTLVLSSTKPV